MKRTFLGTGRLLGLAASDGHTRITQGPNFCMRGGNEEVHAAMTEGMIKAGEVLRRK